MKFTYCNLRETQDLVRLSNRRLSINCVVLGYGKLLQRQCLGAGWGGMLLNILPRGPTDMPGLTLTSGEVRAWRSP